MSDRRQTRIRLSEQANPANPNPQARRWRRDQALGMAKVYVNLVNTDATEALDRVEALRPLARPMPPTGVNEMQHTAAIVAQRRARRLDGEPALPATVIRFPGGQSPEPRDAVVTVAAGGDSTLPMMNRLPPAMGWLV